MRRASLLLVIGLAACSSGDDAAEQDAPLTGNEVAERMREAARDGVQMTPGEYETHITVQEVEIAGLPPEFADSVRQTMGQPFRGCLTEADLEKPDESFFADQNSDCTYEDFSMQGGKVSATMRCAAEGTVQHMKMDGRYREDGYDMSVEMTSEDPQSRMRWTMNSQRIGDCGAQN